MNANVQIAQKGNWLYEINILFRGLATYSLAILAFYELIPLWSIPLFIIALYPSMYASVHDICHSSISKKFGFISRVVPFIVTPIWGGTRVFQETHYRHHLYFATDKDPWIKYYFGHPLSALFFNILEPETNFYNFLKNKGIDREILINVSYNTAFIVANVVLLKQYYLILLLSARVMHGLTVFFFNFYLHRDRLSANADYGVYERSGAVKPYAFLLNVIFGRSVVDGFMYHNRHHCIGQWHVEALSYESLEDTKNYSPHVREWPVQSIHAFDNNNSELSEA
jgi:fatty acid desaturase